MSNICILEVTVPSGSETEPNSSYDSAYTDDDDLDAPPRPRAKLYHSQGQTQALHTSTMPRLSNGKRNLDTSDRMKENKEILVRGVKTWTKPREEGMSEKIVISEDENDGGYERWKKEKQKSKAGKKREFDGGVGESSATDAVVKKRKLSIDKSNKPLASKRPSSRAKQNIMVGRRPVSSELLCPITPLGEPWSVLTRLVLMKLRNEIK